MKYFLSLFIFMAELEYPSRQPCGKHKQSRFYYDKYKVKFGVE